MPLDTSIKKVLMIGSGPIVIGQAAEFDYAGAQACRVLKEAGVNVVLVNSNPATIMTDSAMADEIYLEPLTVTTLERIIEKEKPDSLLAGLGGQTGLTLAMELGKSGFLASHGVRLIGSNVDAIVKAEDRKLFKQTMDSIGEPTIPSGIANDVPSALAIAEKIGYPVIVRPAFTLGGAGGGVAYDASELHSVASAGLDASPITQVLIERYIFGYKEIEFETVRDSLGNAVAVCSMENVDPVGIHTGDSIVVAPALTLSDREYQMLRSASLNIVTALGIVGGCNCQFALDPNSFEYAVIEVNPRVSRSSALASKATGYPIAKLTAKIALGYTLDEITNDVTGKTCACFEPALDYVVVKFPKWPFDKFVGSSRLLGTQMKATGEVMAIGDSFEAALMKAVRGAEISLDTLNASPLTDEPIAERVKRADDYRLFSVFEALKAGYTVDELHDITRIDRFFINKLKGLADFEATLSKGLTEELYYQGKRLGYTDEAIERIAGVPCPYKAPFSYKTVDTCAAEFSAATPYFYSVAFGECESRALARGAKPTVVVLGSGPIRIGQGIEFDYSSVHSVWTLKEMGYDVVTINNNPETVSTDYDTADRLYFEPLTKEDVLNIIEVEKPVGVVVAFGGQTAIKLTKFLDSKGIRILGTSAESIDRAEDRERFDSLLESLSIKRPRGMGVDSLEGALKAADTLGYPVLLRPSYVIGGQNMKIVHDANETRIYMERILANGVDNPVLVDKYMMGTELEVDVISDGTDVLIPGVMEHIERAGVHSGDSIAVYPPYSINDKMMANVVSSSTKLALALGTRGLVNIQYLIYDNELYVIEVNPRASRTVPYISKVARVPMVDIASRVMLGESLRSLGYGVGLYKAPPYVAIKAPVFSFEKLSDANSYLGPEMKSTGEVLGIGKSLKEALFKGLTSSGLKVRTPTHEKDAGALISVDSHDQLEIVNLAKKLYDLGFKLYATSETAASIANLGIDVVTVRDLSDKESVSRLLDSGAISFIVYTGALMDSTVDDYISLHRHALKRAIPCFTSLDTANAMADIAATRYNERNTELVDLNHMRVSREKLKFSKMHSTGNDYIYIDNRDSHITCPESLAVSLSDRHKGVGGFGIVLMERSESADIKMRAFNRDGSEGSAAGSCIMCVAKYCHDHGIVDGEHMTVEAASHIYPLTLYMKDGVVNTVSVELGLPRFAPSDIPCSINAARILDHPLELHGRYYNISCLSVGNPHCVVFSERIDTLDVEGLGADFESTGLFPSRVNVEFARIVNSSTVKMRAYERGNGETWACGTGACAAVIAATELGCFEKGRDVTVKTRGGDWTVNYSNAGVTLTGDAWLVYEGETTY